MRISDWSSDVCSSDLALAPRSRGVIALKIENCTVCMLCARSCPDWCIYIEGHKTKAPPRRPGGKERTVSALDRFDIDYALCMYCGICVEVCPFEALFWTPEHEYSEPRIADLLHDINRLDERSEEHTSELQSLMRISYAVFCLKKK